MIIEKGIVVSCQAREGNPLKSPDMMATMAAAAELGGAVGIRADGVADISAIRKRVKIPIIGINKRYDSTHRIVITPDFDSAAEVVAVGADIIALDATFQESDIRADVGETISRIKKELGVPVMADISTLEEAERAASYGADLISTTLNGYLPGKEYPHDEKYIPNLALIEKIIESPLVKCPVIGEGRFWHAEHIRAAFELGVHALVIGKAITNPIASTEFFVTAARTKTKG